MRVIGQLLKSIGLKPGPERMKAVEEMPTPKEVAAGVRQFRGFVNYLSKFLPSLSELFRKIYLKDALWSWHEFHDKAMAKIIRLIT